MKSCLKSIITNWLTLSVLLAGGSAHADMQVDAFWPYTEGELDQSFWKYRAIWDYNRCLREDLETSFPVTKEFKIRRCVSLATQSSGGSVCEPPISYNWYTRRVTNHCENLNYHGSWCGRLEAQSQLNADGELNLYWSCSRTLNYKKYLAERDGEVERVDVLLPDRLFKGNRPG